MPQFTTTPSQITDKAHNKAHNKAHDQAHTNGPCSIYIAHAGDTPGLIGYLRGFLSQQVVSCIDESSQMRYFRPSTESQLGLFQQLADVDLVLLVLTEGLARSPWIVEEIRIARSLGKRIIVLRPRAHGEHAIEDSGLMDCQVLDLAKDTDRDQVAQTLLHNVEGASIFLSGVDLVHLRALQDELGQGGAYLDLDGQALTEAVLWDLAGNGGTILWNSMLERSDFLAERLAERAGLLSAMIRSRRPIRARLRRYGPVFMLMTTAAQPLAA